MARREVPAQDHGEVVLCPVVNDAGAVIEAFDHSQLDARVPCHDPVPADAALRGKWSEIFGVVRPSISTTVVNKQQL